MVTNRPEITGRGQPARSTKKSMSDRLVYTVPEAGQLLGLGRNAAYEAAKRGDIPTLEFGRRKMVPKIPFHRLLGINESASTAEEASILCDEPKDVAGRREKP